METLKPHLNVYLLYEYTLIMCFKCFILACGTLEISSDRGKLRVHGVSWSSAIQWILYHLYLVVDNGGKAVIYWQKQRMQWADIREDGCESCEECCFSALHDSLVNAPLRSAVLSVVLRIKAKCLSKDCIVCYFIQIQEYRSMQSVQSC